MDIFISWSGDRSRECADALKQWLPRVIQSVRPWISTHDLAKGTRWESVLAKELGQHIYGIICVTPENRESPWLNYEAGALSKTDASRTFTLLIGLTYAEVEQPLAQFNHTLATKADVLSLVRSINESGESRLTDELLQHAFETNWAFMEAEFTRIVGQVAPSDQRKKPSASLRDERSLLEEILESVRAQSKAISRGASETRFTAGLPMREVVRRLVEAEIESRAFRGAEISVRPVSPGVYKVLVEIPGVPMVSFTFETSHPRELWPRLISERVSSLLEKENE